jgi:DME family drug/metabolite transporter
VGELAAISCAVLWAVSTVLMRSQTGRVPVLALNAIRALWASVVFLGVLAALGRLGDLTAVPSAALIGLLGSVLIGMALGDSLHIKAMTLIGVSRALPISSTYPILTAVLAVIWLDEPVTARIVAGIVLVVGGVYLVAFPRVGSVVERVPASGRGITLALVAACCWAISTATVKPALSLVDPLVANGVRLPAAMLVLQLLSWRSEGLGSPFRFGRRAGVMLAVAGLISGVSGALWLLGVRDAGAAKAAALSSTAPIFAAPLAALFLGEKLSRQIGLGTLLTVAGIWLVL